MDINLALSTTHSPWGSTTQTSAGEPTASVPPGSPIVLAGFIVILSISSHYAVGRLIKGTPFVVQRVWRMIRGNKINRSIAEPLKQRLNILPVPQRWRHFGIGAPDRHVIAR